jgi:hypothetical protein
MASNIIPDEIVLSAIGLSGELMESNYHLSASLGIIGDQAGFKSILNLFINNDKARSERNIIIAKIQTEPYKNLSGNKSKKVRDDLKAMVDAGILKKTYFPQHPDMNFYCLGQ